MIKPVKVGWSETGIPRCNYCTVDNLLDKNVYVVVQYSTYGNRNYFLTAYKLCNRERGRWSVRHPVKQYTVVTVYQSSLSIRYLSVLNYC